MSPARPIRSSAAGRRAAMFLHGMPADRYLRLLARGARIAQPVAVVAAHPDDETIGMAARLRHLERLSLIHVTDGAPRRRSAAARAAFASAAAYSAARFAELEVALHTLRARPLAARRLGFRDGETARSLAALIDALATELRGHSVVVTHAYEGGHPDHDSCALAVQLACRRLQRSGVAPVRLEFAGYHSHAGRIRTATFAGADATSAVFLRLAPREQRDRAAALAAYASQPWLASTFCADREAYRAAPDYDFRRPPAPGAWLYDALDWPVKGADWLAYARASLPRRRRSPDLA